MRYQACPLLRCRYGEGGRGAALVRERSRRSARGCYDSLHLRLFLRRGAPAECAADRQDEEADPRQEQGYTDHDPEEGQLLGHVRRVQRRRQRGLGHPQVAEPVLDRLAGLRILRCERLVVRLLAGRGQEAAHLGVPLAARGLQRMMLHDVGELLRLGARVDDLTRLELPVRDLGGVGCRGDLLLRDRVPNLAAAVDAHRDRDDAERNQHASGNPSTVFEELPHGDSFTRYYSLQSVCWPAAAWPSARRRTRIAGFPQSSGPGGEYRIPMESRLRALVESGIAIGSELSLDAVLQKIVETAAELTDARYAALGVVDRDGSGLERFLVTGIDELTRGAIDHEPHGEGILGVLIRDARPLRL